MREFKKKKRKEDINAERININVERIKQTRAKEKKNPRKMKER